ncbi:MAG: nicotinamide-nucleotide amidohydrolase family protein [Lentisphaeria bacterium]|nr:nicotinamide-nucleotide amidohydrolase family protein [Lentisphaeria bacterium]
MSIAVISTGTELLKGTVLNTNLAFLGRELETLGLAIRLALIAGDHERDLYAAFSEALGSADTLIVTGGLGPTRDDITLDATARFFGLTLTPHPELVEKVTAFWGRRHRGRVPKQVLRQARAPQGAVILPNPNGSASGFRIDTLYGNRERRIFLLPGPPREFEPMAHAALLPELARSAESEGHEYTLGYLAAGEPEFQLQVRLEKALEPFPVELAYCATPAGTRVFVSGTDSGQVKAAAELARTLSGPAPLPCGELELPGPILAELGRRGWKLVTAESCTGGMIAAALTEVPGSSKSFRGGTVVYSNEMKHLLLGVPQEIFAAHGAVSAECAAAMVDGAAEKLGAECAIAVTGIAGPASDDTAKPVGLVYIGVRAGKKRTVQEFHFPGDRNTVRERSCGNALLMLYRLLHEDEIDAAAAAGGQQLRLPDPPDLG